MGIRHFVTLILVGSLLLVSWPALAAVQPADAGPYGPVPERSRARLKQRLGQYVSYERAHDFENLYDLFSEEEVARLRKLGRGSKSEWVEFMRSVEEWYLTPLNFTPTFIERRGADEFVIFGHIECRRGPRVVREKGSITAYRERGDWYFSTLGLEID